MTDLTEGGDGPEGEEVERDGSVHVAKSRFLHLLGGGYTV